MAEDLAFDDDVDIVYEAIYNQEKHPDLLIDNFTEIKIEENSDHGYTSGKSESFSEAGQDSPTNPLLTEDLPTRRILAQFKPQDVGVKIKGKSQNSPGNYGTTTKFKSEFLVAPFINKKIFGTKLKYF